MKITTQKEFDSIKSDFVGEILICETKGSLLINRSFDKARINVSYNATIEYVYGNATIESVSGNATIEYVSDNATIEYVSGNATIKYVSDNATIKYVSGNATIKYVYGNATIESVYGNATIESVSGNATIEYVYGNATIKYVSDNATIKYVSDNATIESVSGNATIKYVSDNACILLMTGLASLVLLYSAKRVVAQGMNLIRQIGTKKIDIVKGKNVTFVQIKKTITESPTLEMYKNFYPVEKKGNELLIYKAVHKIDGKYFSEHSKSYEYKIGELKEEKNDSSTSNSCSFGIHISHLIWACIFGRDWKDLAILECEVSPKDIVVSKDCDRKVRASKIKILRELDKNEY